MTKINTDIIKNMDNKNRTMLVLLDISAAFDTVNHDKLTDIMKYRFKIELDKTLPIIRRNIVKLKKCHI